MGRLQVMLSTGGIGFGFWEKIAHRRMDGILRDPKRDSYLDPLFFDLTNQVFLLSLFACLSVYLQPIHLYIRFYPLLIPPPNIATSAHHTVFYHLISHCPSLFGLCSFLLLGPFSLAYWLNLSQWCLTSLTADWSGLSALLSPFLPCFVLLCLILLISWDQFYIFLWVVPDLFGRRLVRVVSTTPIPSPSRPVPGRVPR